MKKCKKCGGNLHGPECKLCEMFSAGTTPGGHGTTCWPMVSEALAVHPRQVDQANERARRHGINVAYDQKGNCHIPDRGNRKKILRLEGLRDNSGGYGD